MTTEIEVIKPQFDRQDGVEPSPAPASREDFEKLRDASPERLEELGLRKWSDDTGLYLFPAEWYDHIPEGFEVTSILDETEPFSKDTHTDDRRFGALPYGITSFPDE